MVASTGEATAVLDLLLSPSAILGLGLLLFGLLFRGSILQSRAGGVFLLVGTVAILVLVSSTHGEAMLHSWPVILFLVLHLAFLWLALHRRSNPDSVFEAPSGWKTPSAAEWVVATGVLLGLFACVWPGTPWQPTETPWFLLPGSELRPIFPPWWLDTFFPLLALGALVALPWLSRRDEADPSLELPPNTTLIFLGLVWLLCVLVPMMWAWVRDLGPGPVVSPVRTLSDVVWLKWAGMDLPGHWFWRESPGFFLLSLHFALWPVVLPRWKSSRGFARRCRKVLGPGRYGVLLALVLLFLLVPLKMVGHWWMGVGPWIFLPEFSIQF